jgi:hypothetical protein
MRAGGMMGLCRSSAVGADPAAASRAAELDDLAAEVLCRDPDNPAF